MLFDDGIVIVCKLKNMASAANMPDEHLVPFSQHDYGERTVGYGRQYAAKGVNEQVDMLIRIWQDRSVRIGMYAVIDEDQYRIDNVQHMHDEDCLKVTDLTLRRLENLYDISGNC